MNNIGEIQNNMNYVSFSESNHEQINESHLVTLTESIILCIFSSLSLKDLINTGSTCRRFKLIADTPSLWMNCLNRVIYPTIKSIPKMATTIKSICQNSQSADPKVAFEAHITLSRLGLRTLESAFNRARLIPISEEARNAHPSSPFYKQSFFDECAALVYACIEKNNLPMAKEIISQMVPSTQRGVLAFQVLKKHLERNELNEALPLMAFIKSDQLESNNALALFTCRAKQSNNIDIGLRAISEFSSFTISLSCIKDLYAFLMENEELEKASQLQATYPAAFEAHNLYTDVAYNAYNNQFEKAIQIAISFPDSFESFGALRQIESIISGKGSSVANSRELVQTIRNYKRNLL